MTVKYPFLHEWQERVFFLYLSDTSGTSHAIMKLLFPFNACNPLPTSNKTMLIQCRSGIVKVTVESHPNTVEHSIRRIDVYLHEDDRPFNPILLFTTILTPVYSEPKAKFTMKLKKSSVIYTVGYCNLHGLWEMAKEIKVK